MAVAVKFHECFFEQNADTISFVSRTLRCAVLNLKTQDDNNDNISL